jgi:hypothetical protein
MAIESINVGNIANDGTGDDLREAFIKVNNNFIEVDRDIDASAITGENLGVTGEGVFAGKEDNTLQFKKILAGNNISVSSTNNSLVINSTGGISDILVLTDNGSVTVDGTFPLRIEGGEVITTRVSSGDTIFFDLDDNGILERDTNPTLSSSLQAAGHNIQNAGSISANSVTGSLTGLVFGVDIRQINKYFDNNWDFGEILPALNNFIDYLIFTLDVDMETFQEPAFFDIDLGSI